MDGLVKSMQRFQIQFYNLSACQEVFDMVHMLIPCQKIPDACLPPSSDMVQFTKQYVINEVDHSQNEKDC